MLFVLGNLVVDEAMSAEDWPAPGQTVVVGGPRRDLGGKGANQAVVAARAGAAVRFVAAIGRDESGTAAAEAIAAEGLAPGDLIRVDAPTDRSLIFVGPGGENAIASIVGAAASLDSRAAEAAVAKIGAGDQLLMQGNLTGAATLAAFEVARRRGAATIFNPSPLRPEFRDLLPLVDLLVVNEPESEALVGRRGADDALAALLRAGTTTAVLTLGRRGAAFVGPAGAGSIAARAVEAVDTTGAGDTFMGVLAAALFYHGMALERAVEAANRAAAVTVARLGTFRAFPSRKEIGVILDLLR